MPKNRLRVLVLTLLLASMIVSGCSNGGVTAQTTAPKASDTTAAATDNTGEDPEEAAAKAYLTALTEAFHKYADASSAYSDALTAEKYDDARSCLDEMENALDEFQSVEAPDKYTPDHVRLRTCARVEQDYVRLCRRFTEFCERRDSLTEEDRVELEGLTNEMKLTESGLADTFLALIKTVKADTDKETKGT